MDTPPLEGIFFKDFKNSYIPNILEEIYKHRIYDPFLQGKKDLIIADWGGNIGLTSYYFKDFAKQVYCVEPSKRHQECVKKLIQFNGIENITLCKYAIAEKDGRTKFYHNANVTMYSLKNTVNDPNDYEEVETLTPESFMEREGIERIDLLKFDTEGNESEIVVSEGFARVAPRIKVIVGEWHNWTSMNQGMFKGVFEDLGYEFKWLPNTEAQVFTAVRV